MTEQGDGRVLETVARAGRDALRKIWSLRDAPGELDPPARRLLAILEQHREFRAFWEGAEPTDEENPFLHVTLHDVVEAQIDSGDPPEARDAFERMTAAGSERHEAIHELLRVLVLQLYGMARSQGEFDQAAYRRLLDGLGRGTPQERG